jgi:heme/copper-type cytochrome/quinol oxidase subunit 2
MTLFFALVVVILSKISTLIMNIVSMHQIKNIMPKSNASSNFTYEQSYSFIIYKTAYILLFAMMLFSFMMLYFGISNKNGTTYVSMSENVIRNLLFFVMPVVVIGILLYFLFAHSIQLLNSSSSSSSKFAKKRKLLTTDLELAEWDRLAALEAARIAAEDAARRKKQQEEDEARRLAEERARAAQRSKEENDAKCGKCY